MPSHPPTPLQLIFFLLFIFFSQYVSNKTFHYYPSKEAYFQLQPRGATHQDHKQAKHNSIVTIKLLLIQMP
jgi:hypothetical protein